MEESIKCESKLLEKLREDIEEDDDDDDDGNENDILKKRISSHPLYALLLQSHINCLKVGGIGQLEIMNESKYLKKKELNMKDSLCMLGQYSELDQFMEAYCFALGKLKEAIEEPQQKSMAFITNMHSQLSELSRPNSPAEPITSLKMVKTRSE